MNQIICVHDEYEDRGYFEDVIRAAGSRCSFFTLDNARKLLNFLELHAGVPPLIVIADRILSAVSRELILQLDQFRTISSPIPIVILSRTSCPHWEEQALDLGASAYYTSCGSSADLKRTLTQIIARFSATRD